MKAVIVGGHVTPAMAVIETMREHAWEIFWIGEKRAVGGHDIKTLEAKIIPGLGIPFFAITSAKLNRSFLLQSIFSFWKIFVGFLQSLFLLVKLRPNVVLSFGSYVSIPVAASAWICGIPIVIHEQTAASGLANRIVARLAKKVAISFPDTAGYFPKGKVVFTGNPLRKSIFEVAERRKKSRGSPPVLYITGGSRGSQAINEAASNILPRLLDTFIVYHQTGDLDYQKMIDIKKGLPKTHKAKYHVAPTYDLAEVEKIYEIADMAVSRAGANTVLELAALGIPVILIPLPYASSNEQARNAEALSSVGTAVIIKQEDLTGETLFKATCKMLESLPRYKGRAPFARRLAKRDAAIRLFEIVEHEAT